MPYDRPAFSQSRGQTNTVPRTLLVPYCCDLGRYRPIRSASYQYCAATGGDLLASALMFGGYFPLFSLAYMIIAVQSWRMLLAHCVSAAVLRALASTGSRMEISSAMMPMTTSNSTRVRSEER